MLSFRLLSGEEGGSSGKIGGAGEEPLPRDHPIVHLSRSFDHSSRVEFAGALYSALRQESAQSVIADEGSGGADESSNVARRNQESALPIFDDLGQPPDSEGDRRNAERHCVDDGGAEAL